MNEKNTRIIGFISVIFSILIIGLSIYIESIILLFTGIFLTMVSAIFAVLIPSLLVFKKDNLIDKEVLIKQGLHIVECKNCAKENVLEDQYCIYCGERLVDPNEEL